MVSGSFVCEGISTALKGGDGESEAKSDPLGEDRKEKEEEKTGGLRTCAGFGGMLLPFSYGRVPDMHRRLCARMVLASKLVVGTGCIGEAQR